MATDTEARRYAYTHRPGQLHGPRIEWLAATERLGPFCLWPNPPGQDPANNVLVPELLRRD